MRRAVALAALGAALVAPSALAGCSGHGPASAPRPSSSTSTSTSSTSASASPAAPSSTPPPTATAAPRPPVRGCYRLSLSAAVAPTSDVRPAPCTRRHTAVTYAVGTLDTVVEGHLLAVDSRRVRAQPARACPPQLASYLGGTREQLRLSMLRPVWFTPTVEESDAGADWFRCDVVALAGPDRLAWLDGTLRGVLGRPAGAAYAMCGTAEPGRPAFQRVTCASRHSWRAVRTIPLSARAGTRGAYPGAAIARAAGQRTCKDVGQRASSDQLNFSWGYEWPSARQWSGGQTYGLCWIPD
jgi:hypothetical protein